MCRYRFWLLLIFNFCVISALAVDKRDDDKSLHSGNSSALSVIDTLKENQILYNGRVWRNIYYKIKEDQFFLSKDFFPGSVTMNGRTFSDVSLRYDIYNDEIMTFSNKGLIIQLNKELVDSFSILQGNVTWRFLKIEEDTIRGFNGYVNVLYKGKSTLYVKYRKEIDLLAVDRKYDLFYQIHRIYLEKDSIIHPVAGRRDLLNLYGEEKKVIKSYINKNRLLVLKKNPWSFVAPVEYYDSLTRLSIIDEN